MKKLLLIVFVLAICVLAFPQGVMAAEATLNANVVPTTGAFTATYASHAWALTAGPATTTEAVPVILTITNCNQVYDISAWDTTGTYAGKMHEWDGATSSYVTPGEELNLPLRISDDSVVTLYPAIGASSATPTKIRSGALNLAATNHYFQQEVQTGELHLPANSYHIAVTIDAAYR